MSADLKPSENPVPHLAEKMTFMLSELGRTQSWLANELNVTAPMITQIKTGAVKGIPKASFKRFCTLLSVTREELTMSDLELFKRTYSEALEDRAGTLWKAFVSSGAQSNLCATAVREPGQPSPSIMLKGLAHEPVRSSMQTLSQPAFKLGQRINFSVAHDDVSLPLEASVKTHVLLLQFNQDLSYISPATQPEVPAHDASAYTILSASGGGFYISEPAGQHTAFLLLLSAKIPQDISELLLNNRTGKAADRLAQWLAANKTVKHSLHIAPFFVSPK